MDHTHIYTHKHTVIMNRPDTGFNAFMWQSQQLRWGWHPSVAYRPNSTYFLHTKTFESLPSKQEMQCPVDLDMNVGPLEQPGLHILTGHVVQAETPTAGGLNATKDRRTLRYGWWPVHGRVDHGWWPSSRQNNIPRVG